MSGPDEGAAPGTPLVTGAQDPSLGARVVRRIPLRYAAGADESQDRPAHVRAGSGLARVGERLVVVQDDANFLALVDPGSGAAEAVPLPAGVGGVRLFDRGRGNKKHKLDLEACVALVDEAGHTVLLAFGSGSSEHRERIAVVRGLDRGPGAEAPDVRLVDAGPLYAALRAAPDFAGAQLNVEGAAHVRRGDGALAGDRVRLLARGNGAARDGREPASATCDVDAVALLAYVEGRGAAPALERVTRWSLGTIAGERLGFTDATAWGTEGLLLFVAAAESSDDVVDDGPVAGSALGLLDATAEAPAVRWAPLLDADGAPFTGKAEGVARDGAGRLWIVLDQDDPDAPSELCEVRLDGDGWGEG